MCVNPHPPKFSIEKLHITLPRQRRPAYSGAHQMLHSLTNNMESVMTHQTWLNCTLLWNVHTCCQACIAVLREWTTCCPKLTSTESMIMVPSSRLCTPSSESAICPETPKGCTTVCIVTFLHSRSRQSTCDENRISWQTESQLHCRRYRVGSLKEITMYSSSDGTFLSGMNGWRCRGEAWKETRQIAIKMCDSAWKQMRWLKYDPLGFEFRTWYS